MAIQHAFHTRKNVLTDDSVIWEIWQEGSDQRLASAATKEQAKELEMNLNLALTDWVDSHIENVVDV